MARTVVRTVTITSDITGVQYDVPQADVQSFAQSLTLPVVTEDGLTYVTYRFDATTEEVSEFVQSLYSDAADTLFDNDEVTAKVKGAATVPGSDDDTEAIRAWGKANGFTVKDKGRLSGELRAAYAKRDEN